MSPTTSAPSSHLTASLLTLIERFGGRVAFFVGGRSVREASSPLGKLSTTELHSQPWESILEEEFGQNHLGLGFFFFFLI
jgi:hypothetical protein